MRVTNPMMTTRLMTNINRNLGNLDTLYTQMSSGKQIQMPSDNPIIATRSLKFRTTVAETEQYDKNVDQAKSWLDITEGAFKNMNSVLTRMNELSVQGASDTYSPEERKKILTEMSSLGEQFNNEMNVNYMGRYVFSGYKTDQAPINADGTMNSNIFPNGIKGQTINLEVGVNTYIGTNILGTDFYTKDMNDTMSSYKDMIKQINDGTAGDAELQKFFSNQMGKMSDFQAAISKPHTDVGVRINKLDLIHNRLEDDNINYTKLLSKNEDIDLVDVITQLNTADAAYTASLRAGMNITKLSLADFI